MGQPDSQEKHRIRRDGWTPERQLRFLHALARSRSVIKAAAAAGMSRESAYRLRERKDGALFAALWDRIVRSRALEVYTGALTDGRLARLLGNHFRRERGDFSNIGGQRRESRGT